MFSHTRTQGRMHTRTRARARTHTHINKHTHTDTHTHTHTCFASEQHMATRTVSPLVVIQTRFVHLYFCMAVYACALTLSIVFPVHNNMLV